MIRVPFLACALSMFFFKVRTRLNSLFSLLPQLGNGFPHQFRILKGILVALLWKNLCIALLMEDFYRSISFARSRNEPSVRPKILLLKGIKVYMTLLSLVVVVSADLRSLSMIVSVSKCLRGRGSLRFGSAGKSIQTEKMFLFALMVLRKPCAWLTTQGFSSLANQNIRSLSFMCTKSRQIR